MLCDGFTRGAKRVGTTYSGGNRHVDDVDAGQVPEARDVRDNTCARPDFRQAVASRQRQLVAAGVIGRERAFETSKRRPMPAVDESMSEPSPQRNVET